MIVNKPAVRLTQVLKSFGGLAAASLLVTGCAKPVPDDGRNPQIMRFDNYNNYRYCEVFLIGGNPLTKDLAAAFYNTTDLNDPGDSRDSCTDAMWARVDAEALKTQYDVLGVFKNGPRYWLYDWFELSVGAQRDFNGLQARWMGQVELPKGFGSHKESTAYKPTTVARKSKQGYRKGQTVFLLEDPQGTPWIMQSYSRTVDPKLSYADLKTLGTKLKLPTGWKYRVKVLDRDLGVGVINGTAHIVQDDLQDTYNACFEADGRKNCTYRP